MPFCQMIDKHATSLETQQAFVTFVDKPMVVRWGHLINKNKEHEEYQFITRVKAFMGFQSYQPHYNM